MKFDDNQPLEAEERELYQAIRNFRQSVRAWSEAEYGRTRSAILAAPRRGRRMAAAWALGCVLAAGSLAGALFDRHHHRELAEAAARLAHAEQTAARQRAATNTDVNLLSAIDSDVSREVPSAMEPLAQLMDPDTNP